MSKSSKGRLDQIFDGIEGTFVEGQLRRYKSEATIVRLFDFLNKLRTDESGTSSASALEKLHEIPLEHFLSASYIFDVSQLIYSLALLDAFLQNLTLYLLLRFPETLKKQTLTGELLLSGKGIGELITELAEKKARDISHAAIEERLEFFQKSFGLTISIPEEMLTKLKRSIEIRNHVVHNEAMLSLAVNDRLEMSLSDNSSKVRPIEFTPEDLEDFVRAHEYVADELRAAMYQCVIKKDIPNYLRLRRARSVESPA